MGSRQIKLFLSTLFWCFASAQSFAGAIFGSDDRALITPSSPMISYARSTAVAVLKGLIIDQGESISLNTETSSLEFLCPNERFRDQSSLPYACTGFLIAPTLLATAGHCMVNTGSVADESKYFCEAFEWLFDYQVDNKGKSKTTGIPRQNLFKCKRIIYAVRDEASPFQDFALVELDRPVEGRMPFEFDTDPVKKTEKLKVIGYPLGTPAQAASNGAVIFDDSNRKTFITNLDAFEGNSGGPVLNSKNKVVGILIGGTPSNSFIELPQKKCFELNRCSEDGSVCKKSEKYPFPHFQRTGTEVQRISSLVDFLPTLATILRY